MRCRSHRHGAGRAHGSSDKAKEIDRTVWKKICLVTDTPVLGSRRVARPFGLDVAVFRNSQDEVFALLDRCPHKGVLSARALCLAPVCRARCTTGPSAWPMAAHNHLMKAAPRASKLRCATVRYICVPLNWRATLLSSRGH